jgi:hypothetical protein
MKAAAATTAKATRLIGWVLATAEM